MFSFASWEENHRQKRRDIIVQKRKPEKKSGRNVVAAASGGGDNSSSSSNQPQPEDGSNNHQNESDTVVEGNPENRDTLYEAIQQDLLEIRDLFCQQVEQLVGSLDEAEVPREETKSADTKGITFKCFIQVAKQTHLTALHRLVPSRCDVALFAQLLYSVCLDLLVSSDNTLTQQAFAMFALYALHETNPIPVGPDPQRATPQELLATMPMNIMNREYPRLLYRRNYRPYIRVDPMTYQQLLVMYQTFLVTSNMGAQSRGMAAVATDVCEILNRLWSHFDLVAYKGPMGLYGLSHRQTLQQHQQQCDQQRKDPPAGSGAMACGQGAGVAVDASMNDSDDSDKDEDSSLGNNRSVLQNRIDSYLELRGKLCTPPPNTSSQRLQRVRQIMGPVMEGVESWHKPLKSFLSHDKDSQDTEHGNGDPQLKDVTMTNTIRMERPERVVAFTLPATDTTADDNHTTRNSRNDNDRNDVEENDKHVPYRESFHLVLPPGLNQSLKQSIGSAVQTLVNRHDLAIFQNRQATDDISTLGAESHLMTQSIAGSSVGTAVGRSALQALIAQAEGTTQNKDQDLEEQSVSTGVGRSALQALIAQAATQAQDRSQVVELQTGAPIGGISFLEEDDRTNKLNKTRRSKRKRAPSKRQNVLAQDEDEFDEDEISDVSSEEEALSTTGASTVGRQALKDLLQEARKASAPKKKRKRQERPVKKPTRKPTKKFAEPPPKPSPHRRSLRQQERLVQTESPGNASSSNTSEEEDKEEEEEDHEGQDTSDSDDSDSAPDDDDDDDDDNSKSRNGSVVSGQGNAALAMLLQKALT